MWERVRRLDAIVREYVVASRWPRYAEQRLTVEGARAGEAVEGGSRALGGGFN